MNLLTPGNRIRNIPFRGMNGIGIAPSFDPATLPGYVDSPYSFAALRTAGKLWQDLAQTTPAVAHNDPVRRMVCGSNNYDAPTDAKRGLLQTDGSGHWWILTDGVDDIYQCSTSFFTTGGPRATAFAYRQVSNTGVIVNLGGVASNNGLAAWRAMRRRRSSLARRLRARASRASIPTRR